MATNEIKRHWDFLSTVYGCVITKQPGVTIHHCHGGSMKRRGIHSAMGAKTSDWLVIPLHWQFHTGQYGIDNGQGLYKGVEEWEEAHGAQAEHLDAISEKIGRDVFELAAKPSKILKRKYYL